ncbi:MAG TPA: hypothetical protein VF595_14950 [Tepidisphaeraceae bacterium]|jgi:Holliday junction resolvasome RuvABC endonuclease subunit
MKKRAVFRIQLTAEAKDRLLKISDELGITQIAVTSKLTEWFAMQPDTVQAAILGLYPEALKQDIATMILQRMAEGKTTKKRR